MIRSYVRLATCLALIAALAILAACETSETSTAVVDDEPDRPEEGVLLKDTFLSPPAPPWEWVRENPTAHKTIQGLVIKIEPGGLMGAGKDAKNMLVRPLSTDAKAVSVSVDTKHQSQYEQAGLLLYHDDDSYIKLVREFVDGTTWIVLVTEIDAQPKVVNKVPVPVGGTWLAMNFTEDGIAAKCWGDDGSIVSVGEATFPMTPRPRIGVFTQSGEADADRWARFTDFKLRSATCD